MPASPVDAYLADVFERCRQERSGAVADYIPELTLADPEWFGICLATTDGVVYEVGDTRQPFTIQSMSKPFTYGLALRESGEQAVGAKIGVEPSGDAFNEISLTPGSGRPLNPMINAGAITATSLVPGRFDAILETFSAYAGRPLDVDEAVYASESETGHRNRAIGHMLRTFGILAEHPDAVLDTYFRQCAIRVSCRDMSLMAAALANGGRNALTGERVLEPALVPRVLSVMTTCGMYDGSGRWVDAVGLPAKSGVGGGIFAVLPGQFGISVFSPRLDEQGNSVRGVLACRTIARELQLHSLRVARPGRATISRQYDLAHVQSRRRRPAAQVQALSTRGHRAHVFELQGDLLFAGAERTARAVTDAADEVTVLDLRGVHSVSEPAERILRELAASTRIAVVGRPVDGARLFDDADDAREWAEDVLLGDDARDIPSVAFAEHDLCRGLDADGLSLVEGLAVERRLQAGEVVFAAGAPADAIYLLLEGSVDVTAGQQRLTTLAAGALFGELAVIGAATRTATVSAATEATVATIGAAELLALQESRPDVLARLLRNMLVGAHASVDRMTRAVTALSVGRTT